MSHSAVSIAPMAEARTRSAGKKPPRKSTCQRCSMRVASCPISSGLACSTNPITASSREVRLDSPTPQMPSSVSTVTNNQLRLSLNTGYVSTLVIFMAVPFTLFGLLDRAAGAPAGLPSTAAWSMAGMTLVQPHLGSAIGWLADHADVVVGMGGSLCYRTTVPH